MVNWYLDIETVGLNGDFRLGVIINEFGTVKVFYDRMEFWKFIIDKGITEYKRGHCLNIYAHNHSFDFHKIIDVNDSGVVLKRSTPFRASYVIEGKEVIHFLDTFNLFPMKLKKIGKLLDLEKLDMSNDIMSKENLSVEELDLMVKYCIRDVEIVKLLVEKIGSKLKEENITIRRLFTSSQIGNRYIIKKLIEDESTGHMFFNKSMSMVKRTKYYEKMQGIDIVWEGNGYKQNNVESGGAYRVGRVEAFKVGEFIGLTFIDINSLFPFAIKEMDFPDLSSEMLIEYPSLDTLYDIGFSRAMVKNVNDDYGILPVRTDDGVYYPRKNTKFIGTWTNWELRYAMQNGYEIIDLEWSVVYNKSKINPFVKIMEELYNKRKSGSEFDNVFYKMLMVRGLGKFAQRKPESELRIASVEDHDEMMELGYNLKSAYEYKNVYEKQMKFRFKNYYCPIIPTLLNAWSRIYMNKMLRRIPYEDLVYTDTDSIIFMGDHIGKFDISEELGSFKIVRENSKGNIWGEKTYVISDIVKKGGIGTGEASYEEILNMFRMGDVRTYKFMTLKNAPTKDLVGSFKIEWRDLRDTRLKHMDKVGSLQNRKVFIDKDINNIEFFRRKHGRLLGSD